MTETRAKRIGGGALVAIAAGLAASLLFALAARGSLFGIALLFFAPLPLMIAALSYGLWIGVGAALIGAGFLALVFQPATTGLGFALAIGGPAVLVAVAAVLAPPSDEKHPRDRAPAIGLLAAAGASTLAVLATLGVKVLRAGGYASFVATLNKELIPHVSQMLAETSGPASIDAADLTRTIILTLPAALAMAEVLTMALNLWLAGRIAVISGNLPRPWPGVADNLVLPPALGAVFALACGLVFVGGPAGVAAGVVAAALGAAFALQGLAVVHVLTRGASLRIAALSTLYAVTLVFSLWPLVPLAVLGLVDAAFHLRTRKSAPKTPSV